MGKKLSNPPMKAVLYHADGHFGKRHGPNIYKHLTEELRKNLHTFGVPLIHVTVTGHEGWGDENYFYDVEHVNEVIYNREKCLLEFLKRDADNETVYWFCEPDFRMLTEFPPLANFDSNQKEWHGDSPAWQAVHKNMGGPTDPGFYKHLGLTVELRPYGWYASRHKARYSAQYKEGSKMQIVTQEYLDSLKNQENS